MTPFFRTLPLFILLAFSATANADPPSAIILGPTGGVPGDILVLDASASNGDFFAWQVTPELPEGRTTILPLEGGRKCLVCSVPGTYTLFLAVGNAKGISLLKHVVAVRGTGPSPPDPQPPPRPDPDLPEGRYGLAKVVYELAVQHVPQQSRSAAQPLAQNYRGVAAQIAAGTLSGAAAILKATTEQNRDAVGEHRDAWQAFFRALAVPLQEHSNAGRLRTNEDFQTAWGEIAIGLEAVR